jgi:hypothetical protein
VTQEHPSARVLLYSVTPDGVRLTTILATMHRFVLAELNTHRMLTKSSASSRAIPWSKMKERVTTNPAMPVFWGKNQRGMQAAEELGEDARRDAEVEWLEARDVSVHHAAFLAEEMDVHKQIANRLIEPWLWHPVIITGTDWRNFYQLRCNPKAQPEFRAAAEAILAAHLESQPRTIGWGEWHMPFIDWDDHIDKSIADEDLPWVSAARCARVSYLTHEGVRDIRKDLQLGRETLYPNGHMAPFEHVARATKTPTHYNHLYQPGEPECVLCGAFVGVDDGPCARRYIGNFKAPWVQLRKTIPHEAAFPVAGDALDLPWELFNRGNERA